MLNDDNGGIDWKHDLILATIAGGVFSILASMAPTFLEERYRRRAEERDKDKELSEAKMKITLLENLLYDKNQGNDVDSLLDENSSDDEDDKKEDL